MAETTNGFVDLINSVIEEIGADINATVNELAGSASEKEGIVFDRAWFEPYTEVDHADRGDTADPGVREGMDYFTADGSKIEGSAPENTIGWPVRDETFSVADENGEAVAQVRFAQIPDVDIDHNNTLTLATITPVGHKAQELEASGMGALETRFLLTPDGTVLFDFDKATGDTKSPVEGMGRGTEPKQVWEYLERTLGQDVSGRIEDKLDTFARGVIDGPANDPYKAIKDIRVDLHRYERTASDMYTGRDEEREITAQEIKDKWSPEQARDRVIEKIEDLKPWMTSDEKNAVDKELASGLVSFPVDSDGKLQTRGNTDYEETGTIKDIRTTFIDTRLEDFLSAGYTKVPGSDVFMENGRAFAKEPEYEISPALKAISNAKIRQDAVTQVRDAVHKSVSAGIDSGELSTGRPSVASVIRSYEERVDAVISTLDNATASRLVELAGPGATAENIAEFLAGKMEPACGTEALCSAYSIYAAASAPIMGFREQLGIAADKIEKCGVQDIGTGPVTDKGGNLLPVQEQKDPEVILSMLGEQAGVSVDNIRDILDTGLAGNGEGGIETGALDIPNSIEKLCEDYKDKLGDGYVMTDYGVFVDRETGISPDTRFTVREMKDGRWDNAVVESGSQKISDTCTARQDEIAKSGDVVGAGTPYDPDLESKIQADYSRVMDRTGQRQFPLSRISAGIANDESNAFINFEKAEKERSGVSTDGAEIENVITRYDEIVDSLNEYIDQTEGGFEAVEEPPVPEGSVEPVLVDRTQDAETRLFDEGEEKKYDGKYTGPDNDKTSSKEEGNFMFREWKITGTPHGISDAGKEALQDALDSRNNIGRKRGFSGFQRYSPVFQVSQLRATCIAYRNGVQINGHTMTALDVYSSIYSIYGLLRNPLNTVLMMGLSVILNHKSPFIIDKDRNKIDTSTSGVEVLRLSAGGGGTVVRTLEDGVTKSEDYISASGKQIWHREYDTDKSYVETKPNSDYTNEASAPDWHGDRSFESKNQRGDVVAEGKLDARGRVVEESRINPVSGRVTGTTKAEYNKDGSSRVVRTSINADGEKTVVEETKSARIKGEGYRLETKTTTPDGNVTVEKSRVDEEGNAFKREELTYDRTFTDSPSRKASYDDEGKLKQIELYEYDKDGSLSKTTVTDRHGNVVSIEERSVDQNTGIEKTARTEYKDRNVSATEITTRDQDKNLVREERSVGGKIVRETVPNPDMKDTRIVRDFDPDGKPTVETVVDNKGKTLETRFVSNNGRVEACRDGIERTVRSDVSTPDHTRTVTYEKDPDGSRYSVISKTGESETTFRRENADGKTEKDVIYDNRTGTVAREIDYDRNGLETVTYYDRDGRTVTGVERFREDGTSTLDRFENGQKHTVEGSAPDRRGSRTFTEDKGDTVVRSVINRDGAMTKSETVEKASGNVRERIEYRPDGGRVVSDYVNRTQTTITAEKNGSHWETTRSIDQSGNQGVVLSQVRVNDQFRTVVSERYNDISGLPSTRLERDPKTGDFKSIEWYGRGVSDVTRRIELDGNGCRILTKDDSGALKEVKDIAVTVRKGEVSAQGFEKSISSVRFRDGDTEVRIRYNDNRVIRLDKDGNVTDRLSIQDYKRALPQEYAAGNRLIEAATGASFDKIEEGAGQRRDRIDNEAVKRVSDQVEKLDTEHPDSDGLKKIHDDIGKMSDTQKDLLDKAVTADGTPVMERLQTADESKDKADRDAVRELKEKVDSLDAETPDENKLKDIQSTVRGLTSDQQKLVGGEITDKIATAEKNKEQIDTGAVKTITDRIDRLDVDNIDARTLNEVKADIEKLTPDQKERLEKETGSMEKLASADDSMAVKSVTDKIDALDPENADRDKLSEIKADIEKLTPEQRTRLENDASATGKLETANGNAVIKELDDRVEKLDADNPSEEQLKSIRGSIEALAPDQKELVGKDTMGKIETAEKNKEKIDTDTVKAVTDKIDRIDIQNVSSRKMDEIKADIEKLTPDQRSRLSADTGTMEKLSNADDMLAVKRITSQAGSLDVARPDEKALGRIHDSISALTPNQMELLSKATFADKSPVMEKIAKADGNTREHRIERITKSFVDNNGSIDKYSNFKSAIKAELPQKFRKLNDTEKESLIRDVGRAFARTESDIDRISRDPASYSVRNLNAAERFVCGELGMKPERFESIKNEEFEKMKSEAVQSITDKIEKLDPEHPDDAVLSEIKAEIESFSDVYGATSRNRLLEGETGSGLTAEEKIDLASENKEKIDSAAVERVSDMVKGIDAERPDDEKLKEVQQAVDSLSPDQKTLLEKETADNGATVADRIHEVEESKERNDTEAVKNITDKIEGLDIESPDQDRLNEIKEDIEKLTADQKTRLENNPDMMDRLALAENAVSGGTEGAETRIETEAESEKPDAKTDTKPEEKAVEKEDRAGRTVRQETPGLDVSPRVEQIRNAVSGYINKEKGMKKQDNLEKAIEKIAKGVSPSEKDDLIKDIGKAIAIVEKGEPNEKMLENAKSAVRRGASIKPDAMERAVEAGRADLENETAESETAVDREDDDDRNKKGGASGGGGSVSNDEPGNDAADREDPKTEDDRVSRIEGKTSEYLGGNITNEEYRSFLNEEAGLDRTMREEKTAVPDLSADIGRALARVEGSGLADENAMKDIKDSVLETTGISSEKLDAEIENGRLTDIASDASEKYINGEIDKNELADVFEKNKANEDPITRGIGETIRNHREDIDSGKTGILEKIRDIIDTAKQVIGDIAGKVAKYGVEAGVGLFAIFAVAATNPAKVLADVVNRSIDQRPVSESSMSVDSIRSLRDAIPDNLSVNDVLRTALSVTFPEVGRILNVVELTIESVKDAGTVAEEHAMEKPEEDLENKEDKLSDMEDGKDQDKTDADAIREAEREDLEAGQAKDVEAEKHDTADHREDQADKREDQADKREDQADKREDRQEKDLEKNEANKEDDREEDKQVDNTGPEQEIEPPEPDGVEDTARDMEQDMAGQMADDSREELTDAEKDPADTADQAIANAEPNENAQDLVSEPVKSEDAENEPDHITEPEPEQTDTGEPEDLEAQDADAKPAEDTAGDTKEDPVVKSGETYQDVDASANKTAGDHADDDAGDATALDEEPSEPKSELEANTAAMDTDAQSREGTGNDDGSSDPTAQNDAVEVDNRPSSVADSDGADERIGDRASEGDQASEIYSREQLESMSDRVSDTMADLITNSAVSYAAGDDTFSVSQEMTDPDSLTNLTFSPYEGDSADLKFADALNELSESGTATPQDVLNDALDRIEERGVPEGVPEADFREGVETAAEDVAGALSSNTDPVTVGERDFTADVDNSGSTAPFEAENVNADQTDAGYDTSMSDAAVADSGSYTVPDPAENQMPDMDAGMENTGIDPGMESQPEQDYDPDVSADDKQEADSVSKNDSGFNPIEGAKQTIANDMLKGRDSADIADDVAHEVAKDGAKAGLEVVAPGVGGAIVEAVDAVVGD